jgi:flagellar protein FliO/FliZ
VIEVWDSIGRTILALGAVLLLMGAMAWIARRVLPQRTGVSGGTPLIQVVASSYLAPRKSIALVAIAGEYFVVGLTADHLVSLGRIDNQEHMAAIVSSSALSNLQSGRSPHSLIQADWWQNLAQRFQPGKKGGPDA